MAGIRKRRVGVAAIAAAVSAIAVFAGSSSAEATTSLVSLERQVNTWIASGQYGKVYDLMPPQQQKVISYAKWHGCVVAATLLVKRLGYDLKSVKFIRAKVLPKKKSMTLSGTKISVRATVVRTTTSMVIRGHRTPSTDPNYWVKVSGKWRLYRHECGGLQEEELRNRRIGSGEVRERFLAGTFRRSGAATARATSAGASSRRVGWRPERFGARVARHASTRCGSTASSWAA